MIVPDYWAEAKATVAVNGKQRTLLRFGWSDVSAAQARTNAEQRANEAAAAARAGQKVRTRDQKVSYNGLEGLPIREEVIARHGDVVVTRNIYGALCLNTPDVVFADIDIDTDAGRANIASLLTRLLVVACGAMAGWYWASWWIFGALVVVALGLPESIMKRVFHESDERLGERLEQARQRVRRFALTRPTWHLRLYRTPQGFRALVMQATYTPEDPDVDAFMKAVHADRRYVQMCRNQKCFRARVSPKPWRIGMERLRPRPGVWPIADERLPERARWVDAYEAAAGRFAACRFETTLGSGAVSPKAEAVRVLHDALCASDSSRPLA